MVEFQKIIPNSFLFHCIVSDVCSDKNETIRIIFLTGSYGVNIFTSNREENMLDEVSLEILKILQEKARIPNVEVSRQIGLAPSAVLERIRKLESNGFIDGYEVRLNPEKFNRRSVAFVHVMVQMPIDPSIGETLSRIPEVQEVHFVSGRDCYLLKIRTEDEASLYRILSEQVSTVRGVISTRTETVLTTIKETNRIQLPTSL